MTTDEEALARLQALADKREEGVAYDWARRNRTGEAACIADIREDATITGVRLVDLQALLGAVRAILAQQREGEG